MIYADLAVIAIILISVFIGIKTGFLRSALGIFSLIISLMLATWSYPVVANIIDEMGISSSIENSIEKNLTEKKDADDEASEILLLPKSTQSIIEKGSDTVIDSASESISSLAVNIISILLVFIVVRIIMFIITHSLNFIRKLPIIKSIDGLFGGILGFVRGVLIVFLILTFITFSSATNSDSVVGKAVKDSHLASVMYDNNFIVNWLS